MIFRKFSYIILNPRKLESKLFPLFCNASKESYKTCYKRAYEKLGLSDPPPPPPTTRKIGWCPSPTLMSSHCFALNMVDFVIFMQFLAILPKLFPHKSTPFGKPRKQVRDFQISFPILRKLSELINSLTTTVPHHIETTQLICRANQLTGFYMVEEHWSLLD